MSLPTFDYIKLKEAALRHPKPANITYSYGTAGFRTRANLLDSVLFRVGILAALRSKKFNSKTIGVMITASHNPEEDNGVKLVDPRGEMLEQAWEDYATQLANSTSADALVDVVKNIIAVNDIEPSENAIVVYARDTRPSGPKLVEALEDGLKAAGAQLIDFGIKTTPQLHYFVRAYNTRGTPDSYGESTEDGYYKKLATAYLKVVEGKPRLSPINVDAANGVGGPKLRELWKFIGEDALKVNIINDDVETRGKLNYNCGADFVKTQQKPPFGLDLPKEQRAASLDGDADRIVYYYLDADGSFRLFDGDKIASLAAGFIIDLVKAAGIEGINVGVVQTAYANGSSTEYLTKVLGVPVACVPTGVKHLHHEAEKYDIGVYFEANGHGTILFSSQVQNTIRTATGNTSSQNTALKQLRALIDLINQTVGDALSDLLLVEAILTHRQWSLKNWDQAYTDLPNRLVKVTVSDRHIFKTIDAERKLLEPEGLQEKLDFLVAQYQKGRSFIRPSGTEDVVRVYAEAATRQECDKLAFKVGGLVYDEAGGTGGRPKEFL
ncbi:hypothetical protein G9A89_005263 [Geosiphon pyriformis]|nr:hypothetical protein G9A89_005263 [Geosiphon pyriformis]